MDMTVRDVKSSGRRREGIGGVFEVFLYHHVSLSVVPSLHNPSAASDHVVSPSAPPPCFSTEH